MRAHADEVFRACLFVAGHQFIGVPLFRFPLLDNVLVAELGGVFIVLNMIVVVAISLL